MKRRSPQLLNGYFNGRFARFVVILFLVYAGVDIANPQLCDEEFAPNPILLAANVEDPSPARFVQRFEGAFEQPEQSEQPSERGHTDEDCFCCCTHVLPALTTHPNGASDAVSKEHTLMPQSVSTAHLNALYHPPRTV